ncbi:MAG: hypothetical protein COU72_01545 [Parcubacteria group bacterium CG10_big_fil_rev_8_21_14_0_10_41_35]|nr:MAG: hypothetical protein COU72_01545 [Parcubacteria group bacterium CG10_big_fil_rev_8_21_14_0_10_41_35]
MNTVLAWIKKYWLVALATIVVVVFTGLPSIVFFQRMGDDFKGVYPVFNSDALYYHARAQEIDDGHYDLNHAYFFEHKDIAYPQSNGAEYFVYGLTKLFNFSAPAMQIAFDFIAPGLIFILTYFLFKKFSSNEYTAVLFPVILYTVVMGGLFKPINPQITFPLLLLFLIFWIKLILNNDHKFRNSIVAGILWGLLFLMYFYHWSFLVVVVGLYMLALLFKKSFSELKYHGLMCGIAVLIGIPYFIRIWQAMDAPFHTETAVRVGQYFSHIPESIPRLLVALVWIAVFAWFVRAYNLSRDKKSYIIGTLLLANIIYPNHQIISGIIIQNAVHWSWMPVFIFALSAHYMLSIARNNKPSFKNISAYVLIALMLIAPAWRLNTFNWSRYVSQYNNNVVDDKQYYSEVFDWINDNTQKDVVIFSDSELMKFIPAYTHANVYNSEYAYNLPGSDQEVIERYLLAHFFEPGSFYENGFGLSGGARILWSFPSESEKNTHTFFRGWGFGREANYEEQYSFDKELAKISGVYESLLEQDWDIALLKKYRLDYIVWDSNESLEWDIKDYSQDLELVKKIGDVIIYKFKDTRYALDASRI